MLSASSSKTSGRSMPDHEQGVGLTQGLECLDLVMPLADLSASFTDELLNNKPVRASGADGLSRGAGQGITAGPSVGSELPAELSASLPLLALVCSVCVAPLAEDRC